MQNILNLPSEETLNRVAEAAEKQASILAAQFRKQSDKLIKSWGDVIQAVKDGIHTDVFSLRDQFVVYKATAVDCVVTSESTITAECSDIQAFIHYTDSADPKSYEFIYDGENWTRDGVIVNFGDICIDVSGEIAANDKLTATVVAEAIAFDIIGFNKETCIPKYRIDITYSGTTATNVAVNNPDDFFTFVSSRAEKTYTFTRVDGDWQCDDPNIAEAADIGGVDYQGDGYSEDDVITITVAKTYTPRNSITLHTHSLLPEIPFDGEEAFFRANSSLKAGTYNFVNTYNNKTMQFTATKPFQRFRLDYNKQIFTYSDRGADIIETLTIAEGTAGTALTAANGAFNHCYRSLWGNNRWDLSYMRSWANSKEQKQYVYQKTHDFDLPPVSSADYMRDGFLRGLDPQFLRAISKVVKKTALAIEDGGGYVETEDLFFPLSATEWHSTTYYTPNGLPEGEPYDVYDKYSDFPAPNYSDDKNRAMYYNGCEYDHWQRSACYDDCYNVQCVGGSGYADGSNSASDYYCADLACVITG